MSAMPNGRRIRGGIAALAGLALLAALPAAAQERPEPEPPGGGGAKAAVVAERQMVVAAHPRAAEAGLAMLRAGGSAVDAAIAAQMVLTLVEPQSSGIGGGAFMIRHDAATGRLVAYDGRETAPAAARPDLFLDDAGTPMAFFDAVVGGRSVGVPGLLRMLELAHRDAGRLPWATLFEPAIRLAERGFPVSPRLAALIAGDPYLRRHPETARYFHTPDGAPLPVGFVRDNPALADTLRRIASGGADAFYTGEIARDIVAAVRSAPGNPGLLSPADLAGYAAKRREPVCGGYRGWRLCGPPPPSSGPLAVLQILGVLERFDLAAEAPWTLRAAHLFAEAGRLAFADRAAFVADPDFVDVPAAALLDPAYLARRSQRINPARSMGKAEPGRPLARRTWRATPEDSDRPPSTSHLVVVDAAGDVVAMTSSIENAFGSRLMVRGFLLNNQLTDFAFRPEADGVAVANRVEPGKRPRSAMAPMIGFGPDGRPALAVGSPGGSRIIPYVAKVLVAVIDWGLDVQAAVALPNIANRNGPTDLEAGTAAAALAPGLEALGHRVTLRSMTSGLHAIRILPGRLVGGADPRREGVAVGD